MGVARSQRAAQARAEGLPYLGIMLDQPFPYFVRAGGDVTTHRAPDMATCRQLALTLLIAPSVEEVRVTALETTRDEGQREGLVAIYRRSDG